MHLTQHERWTMGWNTSENVSYLMCVSVCVFWHTHNHAHIMRTQQIAVIDFIAGASYYLLRH